MSSASGSTGNPPGGAAKRRSMLPPPKSYTRTKTADQTITKSGSEEIRQHVNSSSESRCNTTVSLSRVPEACCLKVGDRVKISGVRTGVVRFCGPTHFAEGQWYGIELDDPEGRHDGLIEGTRYFQCKPNHGLFAPIHKVEVFTEDLYMYDSEAVYATSDISSCDERSPSPDDGRGNADKTVRVKPHICRTLSHPSDQQPEKSHAKPRSRLVQKKVWHSMDLESTDTTSSSRESSTSHESDTGKVKKAEKRSASDGTFICKPDETFTVLCSPHEKKTKMSHGKQELNTTYVTDAADENIEQLLDVYNSSRVDDHTAHVLAYGVDLVSNEAENRSDVNDTYSVQDNNETFLIDSKQTVTHEREVSKLENTGCVARMSSSGQTPDILTNCTFVKQPSLEWDPEEEGDKLGMSAQSKTSSLGILSDTQLVFENNFVDDLSQNVSPHINREDAGLMAKQKHAVPEVIEAELDKEIAGMATPEIDVSSSTVSGKEDGSSPEPDQTATLKKDLDLPITLPDVRKSKEISPPQTAQKSAGEKLATPSTEVITVKDYGDKFQGDSGARGCSHSNDGYDESDTEIKEVDLKEHRLSASFELAKTAVEQYASLVKGAEEEKTIQHEKIKSLKTQDLMSVSLNSRFQFFAGMDVKGLNDETFPDNLMTSITLEPGLSLDEGSPDSTQLEFDSKILNLTGDSMFTADSGQVELANETETSDHSGQAPSDSQQILRGKRDGLDVGVMVVEGRQVTEDVSQQSYPDNSDSRTEVHQCQDLFDRGSGPITGGEDGLTVGHRTDAEQLMADLEAGHTRVERPVSLVSSCSADTGIVVDYRDGTRERPFSMASTSSADTGYQAEQDTESVSGTTSCTLSGTNGSSPSDVIMQSDIAMDTVVIPEFKGPPPGGATSVTLEASKIEKHDQKEDHMESDEDQPASPEGITVTAEPEEMSGTESQQGEELGEITVQEELTPEADVEDEHMIFQQDEVTISQSVEESEIQANSGSGEGHSPMTLTTGETVDTEMVESATMKDVMEKCVAVESEKLVKDIQVEAHIEKREIYKEPVKTVTEHESGVSLDRVKEEAHESIIADGDSLADITPLEIEDDQGEGGHNDDEEMIDATNITDTSDAAVDNPGLPVEKKVVNQAKDKIKTSTPIQIQKHQSQLKKRKDENIATSKLQTKGSRQQTSLRTNPKISSQNIPVPSKVNNKVESDRKMPANKLQKNVSNKKKAEKSLTKIMLVTSDKKGKSLIKNFDKEKSLAKVRKELDMLPSVPSESIAPHLKTVEVHPVLEQPEGDKKTEGVGSKTPRRSLPQRKFSGVKSQIDSGLRSTAKSDPKSRKSDVSQVSAATKISSKPRHSLPQPSAGLVKRSAPHTSSVTSSTGSKVGNTSRSRTGSSDARMPKQSRWSLHTGRQHLDAKMSGSQQSLSSDQSGKASQSTSAADRTSAKRKSSSYRDRSSSTGSECRGQQSSTSAVSIGRTKPPPGKQSLIIPPGKRTITEPRRLSAAVTSSQGAIPKVTKRSQSLVTSTPAGKRTIGLAKSKTQKGGTSSSLSSSMKQQQQQQQPDLVTNAITRSNVTKEITRLEALCEARTKELNKIKIELKRQNTGFEAVAIVVKYFTEELTEAKEQLKKAVLQLEELTHQRDALIDEIQSIKQQHVEETESLMSKHQESLSALSKKLTAEKEEEVKQVIEKHSHEVTTLKSFHERNIKELEEKHDKLMAEKHKQYEEELTHRRLDHEKQINDLHLEHESKLNEITMRFETIKLNLLEKVEYLRMEGEELRRREAAMTEKCQRESDYKIQHALAQYKQDVDSLTAVLDLRNGEIHELQRQNLELQKELEKLPVAQEKIKSLEQQIENLQAIIDIRANNERSLSEKHHVLLRKYDKETKVMKRLSMDNEELMYRLQMEAGYQDVMRRSISHSPTSSETSTPEPTRRHKSPLPQSPRSPCEPKRSPVQKTAPRGSMKRTGTYEVLPQEYDDMNNIKQSDI